MLKRKNLLPGITIYVLFVVLIIMNINCGGDEKSATEPAQTGTINGIVSDAESSLPLGAVNVTTLPPTSAVTTDTTGAFSILNVLPETYSVRAAKVGYQTDSVRIAVTAGHTTIADIVILKDSTTVSPF